MVEEPTNITSPNSEKPVSHFLNFSDQNNPYWIENGDNIAAILVTDLLTTENYVTWSRAMRRALRAKNKIGFINGDIKKPTSLDDLLMEAWEHCNNVVVSWIHNSISNSGKSSLAFVDDAYAIWSELQDRLSQQNVPLIFQLKKSLASLSQGDELSIYFGKIKTIWDELIMYDLMPELGEATKMIFGTPSPDLMPMLTKKKFGTFKPGNRRETPYCTHSRISGHVLDTCFKAGNAEAPVCNRCHISGPMVDKYYKLHGYPPGHKLYNKAKGPSVFVA
ncbi:uncharacterized protein LOC122297021 [Carya illinoinensis]|uniref:uncharacterized protein LOC122297021 n=1 Tax=Carya illinoinensis TaxID=32201 RepID=UPI001C71DF3B|nr:uncharacterized protein LOC122297021 [Carya illinoinensis]